MPAPSATVNEPCSETLTADLDATADAESFVDRRREAKLPGNGERRQFGSSHFDLSEPGRELAMAIDQYKIDRHRRYLTCDEILGVIKSLGYNRDR